MKLGKKLLLATGFACAFSAQAAVEVKFAPDVEAMIVNGEQTFNLLESTKDVTLDDGLNQIVVRVSKLVEGQGQLEKYRSVPMVLTFTAAEQHLLIKPNMRILNAVDKQNFNANPRMKLTTLNGVSIDATIDILPKEKNVNTSNLLGRNYLKELALYNQSKGYALVGEGEEVVIAHPEPKALKLVKADVKASVTTVPVAVKTVKAVSSESDIKSLFSQLTPEQRKAFLGWAVTQ